jgi:hypothetical protein
MHPTKLLAIVLITIGLTGFAFGAFNYTLHHDPVHPVDVSLQQYQPVVAPMVVGLGAMLLGGLMLVLRRSESPEQTL